MWSVAVEKQFAVYIRNFLCELQSFLVLSRNICFFLFSTHLGKFLRAHVYEMIHVVFREAILWCAHQSNLGLSCCVLKLWLVSLARQPSPVDAGMWLCEDVTEGWKYEIEKKCMTQWGRSAGRASQWTASSFSSEVRNIISPSPLIFHRELVHEWSRVFTARRITLTKLIVFIHEETRENDEWILFFFSH